MKDNIAYVYNGVKFISGNKYEIINDLITNHMDQIEESYGSHKGKLRDFTKNQLELFINEINNTHDQFKDNFNKSYKNFKNYKINDIKMLIYNLSDSKKLEALKTINLNEKIIK